MFVRVDHVEKIYQEISDKLSTINNQLSTNKVDTGAAMNTPNIGFKAPSESIPGVVNQNRQSFKVHDEASRSNVVDDKPDSFKVLLEVSDDDMEPEQNIAYQKREWPTQSQVKRDITSEKRATQSKLQSKNTLAETNPPQSNFKRGPLGKVTGSILYGLLSNHLPCNPLM